MVLFVLAMLHFFDLVTTLTIPLRAWTQKRVGRELLVADRPRNETGISLSFSFFSAGLVFVLLSFSAARLSGG